MKKKWFNIINVFTVTFDQFNASLMNKSLNSFKKEFLYWYSQYQIDWMTEAGVSYCKLKRFSLATSLWSLTDEVFPLVWSVGDLQLWHSEQRRVFEMWDPIRHWHQISAKHSKSKWPSEIHV